MKNTQITFLNADGGQRQTADQESRDITDRWERGRLQNMNLMVSGAAGLGNVAGLILAYRQKKRFWGYVGYMILGGLVFGGVAAGITIPFRINVKNKAREARGETKFSGEDESSCCGQ